MTSPPADRAPPAGREAPPSRSPTGGAPGPGPDCAPAAGTGRSARRRPGDLARARAAVAAAVTLAASAGALGACDPEAPPPAPRVLSVSPQGDGVAPDAPGVAVAFSEPVDAEGVEDGRWLALARGADAEAVARDAGAAAGIGAGAPVVPARIALADAGRRADVVPAAPLDPLSGYAVVVGTGIRSASGRSVLDPTGRKRVLTATFRTGPMPDREGPVPRWRVPPHGPVPPNLAELRVAFSEPVTGALSVAGAAGAPGATGPAELELRLLGPLPPGTLAPSLDGVRDAAGNRPLPLEPLAVSRCRDLAPPAWEASSVRLLAADTSLSVATDLDEVAKVGLEVAAATGEPACGDVPAPPSARLAWGSVAPCPGWDPCGGAVRCPASAVAGGLCPGRRHRVRLRAVDLAGNEASPGPWLEASTGAAVARPVLTEVLADATAPEAGGEYVEVANLGSGDADLAGWRLAKRSASGAVTRCTVEPLGAPVPPGRHGLLVGGAWDGRYRLPPGVPLFRCGAGALAGGIASDRPPALALESPDGAVVSGMGWGAPSLRCAARSLERILPAGPDAATNLACAPAAPGTPGACNGATPPEACPRRPW
jgi:hypothetical protein